MDRNRNLVVEPPRSAPVSWDLVRRESRREPLRIEPDPMLLDADGATGRACMAILGVATGVGGLALAVYWTGPILSHLFGLVVGAL